MASETYITHSPEETQARGAKLAGTLRQGDTLLLFGDLGAGKTTFVQGLAEALGFTRAASPTFTILHPYDCELAGCPIKLYHFDCYRLSDADELYECGLDEFLDDTESIAVVEWPENIRGAWPKSYIEVLISSDISDENGRRIEINRIGGESLI